VDSKGSKSKGNSSAIVNNMGCLSLYIIHRWHHQDISIISSSLMVMHLSAGA